MQKERETLGCLFLTMMKCDMRSDAASLPHMPGEVAGERGAEEMPVAEPLTFSWRRYKHIDQ